MNETLNQSKCVVELEYQDGSYRVIARDTWCSPRINKVWDSVLAASKTLRKSIRSANIGYSSPEQGQILAHAWINYSKWN